MEKVIIVGAGLHAKVIADILLQNNEYEIVGLIDEELKEGFFDLRVLGNDSDLKELYQQGICKAFIALGSNVIRRKVYNKVKEIGYDVINVISKHAVLSSRVRLGEGIAIMPGVVINADTSIGTGCIINTNTSIDHDGTIGEFTHIAPGSAVAGSVGIGKECFLGIGSRVIDGIVIGDYVTIGAGTVIIKNTQGNQKLVGVPARNI